MKRGKLLRQGILDTSFWIHSDRIMYIKMTDYSICELNSIVSDSLKP